MTSTLILYDFELELETILELDALDYIISHILLKKHPYSKIGRLILHLVAFMSEKMSPTEYNYGIRDKELLAIILGLQK